MRFGSVPSAVMVMVAAAGVAGCGSKPPLPQGAAAYSLIPSPNATQSNGLRDYRIGALDKINITVFGEEDLSVEELQVDASGNILFPLIGSVAAAGKTTSELSREIASRLNERYLVNAQVSTNVETAVSQRVTVEGAVNESGIYEILGPTTLIQSIALAKGTSRTAALDQVAVFRTIDGRRMGALFDVQAIRRGEADDPQILGNDVVVVGGSGLKAAFRDLLQAAPAFAIFTPIL